MDEEKHKSSEHEHSHSKKGKSKITTEALRNNPWILSTLVLGILVIIFLVGSFGMTGNAVSKNEAGEGLVALANSQGVAAELVGVESQESFYKVDLLLNGQEVPYYVTQEGYLIGGQLVSVIPEDEEESSSSSEVVKSDKPVSELFIWSYCPYGVQAQKPFAEVAKLLGDDSDFRVVLYYDGHGEFETQQNKIQACMQNLYPEKYWDYATRFVDEIYPNCGSSKDVQCNEDESIALMNSLGIDSSAVMACADSEGQALVDADYARAQELGVTGSPTLVVNGAKVSPSSRTAEAFKSSVCSAFNEAPEVCGTELSSEAGTASGSC